MLVPASETEAGLVARIDDDVLDVVPETFIVIFAATPFAIVAALVPQTTQIAVPGTTVLQVSVLPAAETAAPAEIEMPEKSVVE
jgi:hypothetical protein